MKTQWINEDYLQQLLAGRKTIEVRMGYSNIRKLSAGNILLLNEQRRYVIRQIGSYASFEELLLHEDPG